MIDTRIVADLVERGHELGAPQIEHHGLHPPLHELGARRMPTTASQEGGDGARPGYRGEESAVTVDLKPSRHRNTVQIVSPVPAEPRFLPTPSRVDPHD